MLFASVNFSSLFSYVPFVKPKKLYKYGTGVLYSAKSICANLSIKMIKLSQYITSGLLLTDSNKLANLSLL